jgi:thiamine kinase-like enzyme
MGRKVLHFVCPLLIMVQLLSQSDHKRPGATKNTWKYFLEKVWQKNQADYPGASFGQQSKLASALYKAIPDNKIAWF